MEPATIDPRVLLRRFNIICQLLISRGRELVVPHPDEVRDQDVPLWERILGLPPGALTLGRFTDGLFFGLTDEEVRFVLLCEQERGEAFPLEQRVLERRRNPCVQVTLIVVSGEPPNQKESLGSEVEEPLPTAEEIHLEAMRAVLLDTYLSILAGEWHLSESTNGQSSCVVRKCTIKGETLWKIILNIDKKQAVRGDGVG